MPRPSPSVHRVHAPHLSHQSAAFCKRTATLFAVGTVAGLVVASGLDAIYTHRAPAAAASAPPAAVVVQESVAATSPLTVFAALDRNRFVPQQLTVHAGTRVTWVNREATAHLIRLPGESTTPLFGKGSSFSHTFAHPGEVTVDCPIHPGMTAHVTVTS